MLKTVAEVEGMACGMCEAHINDAIRRSFDVKKVYSSRRKRQTVIISESALDENALRRSIEDLGYTVLSVKTEQY